MTTSQPGPLPALHVVQATTADVDTFLEIHEETARWLWNQGIHQWRPGAFQREWLDEPIARGELYLARDSSGVVVATVLTRWSDEEIWGPQPPDAGYIHGLRVRRSSAGRHIGRSLLAWAEHQIAAAGKRYARLDCIADNPRLVAYYEAAGYIRVRDGALAGTALARFQKDLSANSTAE